MPELQKNIRSAKVRSASLAASYADGDVEEMWRVRDAQCPMGHMGDGWDVAHVALFLASDDGDFVTGQTIYVDGGLLTQAMWPYEG